MVINTPISTLSAAQPTPVILFQKQQTIERWWDTPSGRSYLPRTFPIPIPFHHWNIILFQYYSISMAVAEAHPHLNHKTKHFIHTSSFSLPTYSALDPPSVESLHGSSLSLSVLKFTDAYACIYRPTNWSTAVPSEYLVCFLTYQSPNWPRLMITYCLSVIVYFCHVRLLAVSMWWVVF